MKLLGERDEERGLQLLQEAGGVVRSLDAGVTALDLVPQPWRADPQALSDAQMRIQAQLEQTGVFAVARGRWDHDLVPRRQPPSGFEPR